jgi:type II secretory pathway component GspD/PulD (secretin)
MNTKFLKSKCWLATRSWPLSVCAGESTPNSGAAPPAGGGGFGGFGGFGGGNANRSGSTTGSQQYNANGTVGNATISYDPDTHNITIMADEDTTRNIRSHFQPGPSATPGPDQSRVPAGHAQRRDGHRRGRRLDEGNRRSMTGQVANSFGLSSLGSGTGSNAPTSTRSGCPCRAFRQIAPFAAGAGAGMYQILGNDFQATLRAIAQAGKAEVLSRPSILARNNQPASVVVGQYVPLITSVSYNSISGAPINSVTYTDVGIILTVTPYITSDGMVEMIVAPQDSSIDPTLTVPIAQGSTPRSSTRFLPTPWPSRPTGKPLSSAA